MYSRDGGRVTKHKCAADLMTLNFVNQPAQSSQPFDFLISMFEASLLGIMRRLGLKLLRRMVSGPHFLSYWMIMPSRRTHVALCVATACSTSAGCLLENFVPLLAAKPLH